MPITYTPIRYPGGKSKLYPIVDAIIEENNLMGCTYAEAYCGGAGLAMKLLLKNRVSKVVLNDIDPAVYSMWNLIVDHSEELCGFISEVPLTIDEWKAHREVFLSSNNPSLELGKAAFYLNRTNRSGILRGGPIGGKSQNGAYKIDARFNRDALCEKVRAIASRSEDIELYNMDAGEFIDFANFDPPYVEKGPGLYENHYTENDHAAVAKKISSCSFRWIVTYDSSPLVEKLYNAFDRYMVSVGYSAAASKVGSEVLIASPDTKVPESLGLVKNQATLEGEIARRKEGRQSIEVSYD